MSNKVTFYIIEDDKHNRDQIVGLLSKAFSHAYIHDFDNAISAWKKMMLEKAPVIAISKTKLPKMNGIDLLHKIRDKKELQKSYVFLMTEGHHRDDNLKILKEGANDFINKPFEIDVLISKFRNADEILSLKHKYNDNDSKIAELEQRLEQETENQKNLIVKLMQIRLPELSAKINEIRDASVWIAHHLTEKKDEIDAIKNAAELAYCGRALLSEKSIDKPVMISGRVQNEEMKDLPEYYKELTNNIRNYEKITEILIHIYENYDGTGFPDMLKQWHIPLGSRILRVILDHFELMKKFKDNASKTMDAMFHEGKRLYDFKTIAYLDQYFATRGKASKVGFSGKEVSYEIKELESGMTVSRNIITDSAMILMSAGSVLNDEKIERIRTIVKSDPIIGKIYIKEK